MVTHGNSDTLAQMVDFVVDRYRQIESSLPLLSRELSPVERRALKVVSTHQRVTIGAIGTALDTPPSTTTWIVGQLVDREIFKRTRDTHDRRKVWIELAGKGDALARLMERIPDRIASDLLYKVEEEEQAAFLDLIETVMARIEEDGSFK